MANIHNGRGVTKWAVVALDGDEVRLEVTNPPEDPTNSSSGRGFIWGLVADKSTGEIRSAGVGRKGETRKAIKIERDAASAADPAPAGTDEDVTVKAGTFKAKKFVQGPTSWWMGLDGEVKDLVLKSASTEWGELANFELSVPPAWEEIKIGDKTTKVKHVQWTNLHQQWFLPESWPFVGAVAMESVAGVAGTAITGRGEDAKPELDWDGN
jgi:hypothetical protein